MKAPPRLQALIDEGLIDTVVRQLMSGKEAMVYVVRHGDDTLCAKIYKEATQRSFRQARAMAKGTRFGRQAQEAAWQSAEVDALYRLATAGVVHGDLSEFNILLAEDGPVIIDLPQAVDAAGNNHAARMLLRDVDNLRRFFGQFAPALLATAYGPEI
jgi:RIO kinase 1